MVVGIIMDTECRHVDAQNSMGKEKLVNTKDIHIGPFIIGISCSIFSLLLFISMRYSKSHSK